MRASVMVIWLGALSLVSAPLLAGTTTTYSTGTKTYRLSLDGDAVCAPITDGAMCIGPDESISVNKYIGCFNHAGAASCIVLPPKPPLVFPSATSTLECEGEGGQSGKNYQLSTGTTGGTCSDNDGEAMTCRGDGGNYASASCEGGCGSVGGAGSCTFE